MREKFLLHLSYELPTVLFRYYKGVHKKFSQSMRYKNWHLQYVSSLQTWSVVACSAQTTPFLYTKFLFLSNQYPLTWQSPCLTIPAALMFWVSTYWRTNCIAVRKDPFALASNCRHCSHIWGTDQREYRQRCSIESKRLSMTLLQQKRKTVKVLQNGVWYAKMLSNSNLRIYRYFWRTNILLKFARTVIVLPFHCS